MKTSVYFTVAALTFLLMSFMYFLVSLADPQNCSGFKDQHEAQQFFDQDPEKWAKLDRNHNGIPCEALL